MERWKPLEMLGLQVLSILCIAGAVLAVHLMSQQHLATAQLSWNACFRPWMVTPREAAAGELFLMFGICLLVAFWAEITAALRLRS